MHHRVVMNYVDLLLQLKHVQEIMMVEKVKNALTHVKIAYSHIMVMTLKRNGTFVFIFHLMHKKDQVLFVEIGVPMM
jgi:hypothetical protein